MGVMAETSRRWVPVTHATVRVRCPDCDQISDVATTQIQLFHCTTRISADFYCWPCPQCGQAVSRPADVASYCLLTAAGIPTRLYSFPEEMADSVRAKGPWGAYETDDLLLDIDALPTFHGEALRLRSEGDEAA